MSKITGQDVANKIQEARASNDGPGGISEQEWKDIRTLVEQYKGQRDVASLFGFGASARKNALVGALGFGTVGRALVNNLWDPNATYDQLKDIVANNPFLEI